MFDLRLISVAVTMVLPLVCTAQTDELQRLRNENVRLRIKVRELESRLDRTGPSSAGLSSLDGDPTDDEGLFGDIFSLADGWDDLTTVAEDEAAEPDLSLDAVASLAGIPHDNTVDKYVDIYSLQKKDMTIRAFARYGRMDADIRAAFRRHGVPEEFSVLCIVESAANTRAKSKAGALGLWQFMAPTARDFGLIVNDRRDDRLDAELSTEAAAAYLAKLYGMFGDWALALMAYNCGEGNMQKAIAASGGDKRYSTVVRRLPRETQDYVPALVAIMYININQSILYA